MKMNKSGQVTLVANPMLRELVCYKATVKCFLGAFWKVANPMLRELVCYRGKLGQGQQVS